MRRGLIGKTLKHSYSKELHELIVKELFNEDRPYELISLNEDEVIPFFKAKAFDYVNVTIPYKTKVLDLITYDDDISKEIKSVNLVINKKMRLFGYNTDYVAFSKMLDDEAIDVNQKKILVLGTGGSSEMVQYYVTKKGAQAVHFASRTKQGVDIVNYKDLSVFDYQVIINTTPAGMYPDLLDKIVDLKKYSHLELVIDIIYNPFRTALIQEAIDLNIKTINGLRMLIYQAIFSVLIYENKELSFEIKDLVHKIEKIIYQKRNIVLIGMPGVGKSSVAKKLSSEINYPLYDVDEIIANRYGPIKTIFATHGEDYFRKIEKEVISELALKESAIISTGGGVILDYDNIIMLKAKGIAIYLKRPIDDIIVDDKRPLMKTIAERNELYEKRKGLYEKYADYIIDNCAINGAIKKIKKIMDVEIEELKQYDNNNGEKYYS